MVTMVLTTLLQQRRLTDSLNSSSKMAKCTNKNCHTVLLTGSTVTGTLLTMHLRITCGGGSLFPSKLERSFSTASNSSQPSTVTTTSTIKVVTWPTLLSVCAYS